MTVDPIRSKEDIKKLKELAEGRDRLLLEIGFNSGLRIGDILRITAGDIKNNKYINIKEQKTGKGRKVSLPNIVKQMALEYIKDNNLKDGDYLFQSREGGNKAISSVQAYRVIKTLAKKAKLKEKIGTHTLRKSYGFHHYRQYKDVALLQSIFNHSTPKITLDYIGVTQDEIDKTAQEMYL